MPYYFYDNDDAYTQDRIIYGKDEEEAFGYYRQHSYCPFTARLSPNRDEVNVTHREYPKDKELVKCWFDETEKVIKMQLSNKNGNSPDFISFLVGSNPAFQVDTLSFTDFKCQVQLPGYKPDAPKHCDVWYHSNSIRVSKKKNEHPNSYFGPAVTHIGSQRLEHNLEYKLENLEPSITEEMFKQQYLITHLEDYVPPTVNEITLGAARLLHPSNYDPTGVIHYALDATIKLLNVNNRYYNIYDT